MDAGLHNAFNDLVATVFSLYLYTVLVRILLQVVRADFYNPVSQAIWQLTRLPIAWIGRVIPKWRRLDLAACVYLLALVAIYVLAMTALWGQRATGLEMLTWTLLKVPVLVLNLYLFMLIVQAVLSWVGPGLGTNPAGSILWSMNEPLLRPVRRLIPPMSGLDFSPLAAMLVLLFIRRVLVSQLPGYL